MKLLGRIIIGFVLLLGAWDGKGVMAAGSGLNDLSVDLKNKALKNNKKWLTDSSGCYVKQAAKEVCETMSHGTFDDTIKNCRGPSREDILHNISKYIHDNHDCSKAYSFLEKSADRYAYSAEILLLTKCHGGCAQFALKFIAIARRLGIPSLYLNSHVYQGINSLQNNQNPLSDCPVKNDPSENCGGLSHGHSWVVYQNTDSVNWYVWNANFPSSDSTSKCNTEDPTQSIMRGAAVGNEQSWRNHYQVNKGGVCCGDFNPNTGRGLYIYVSSNTCMAQPGWEPHVRTYVSSFIAADPRDVNGTDHLYGHGIPKGINTSEEFDCVQQEIWCPGKNCTAISNSVC